MPGPDPPICMFLITTHATMKGYDSVEEDVPARVKQLFKVCRRALWVVGFPVVECDPKQLLCELCGFLKKKRALCGGPGKSR